MVTSSESGSLLMPRVRNLQVHLAPRHMCWGRKELGSERWGEQSSLYYSLPTDSSFISPTMTAPPELVGDPVPACVEDLS